MIYVIIVFDIRKGSGIHRKGFRMFPEMFGYENTLYWPRGKSPRGFGSAKGSFATALSGTTTGKAVLPHLSGTIACQAVLPLVRGIAGIRVGLFSCRPNRPCAGKTDLEETFTPSLDPKAQHINRGAGLAHDIHQDFSKSCAATLIL